MAFKLHHDNWGRLVFTGADGIEHVGVEPIRSFPITDPENGISVCDSRGRELAWVDNLANLPDDNRTMLTQELARREFVPILLRVIKVSTSVEPADWDVETDRGRTRFILKSEEDVRRLAGHRAMITDSNGLRYLIPDTRTLDPGTARVLERYL